MRMINDKDAEIFYEFGKFICTFATVEHFVHLIFGKIAELDQEFSRAIVGGETLAKVMEVTKRLTALKGDEQKLEEVTHLFNQLSSIAAFRHALIHRGIEVETTRLQSSNFYTAKTKESTEILTYELAHIQRATMDLGLIQMRLIFLIDPDFKSRLKLNSQSLDNVFHSPWQYKDVRSNIENRPRRKARQKPSRQRLPSPK